LQALVGVPATLREFLLANGPLEDWGSDDEIGSSPFPFTLTTTFARRPTPTFAYANERPNPLLMESQMEIDLADEDSPLITGNAPGIVELFEVLRRIPRVRNGHSASNVSFTAPSSTSP